MIAAEALHIVDALARGIDPESGEILPEDDCLNRPSVVRALFLASAALSQAVQVRARPGMAGKPWSAEDDAELVKAFDEGATAAELAAKHGRSRGGIASRLVRLGRIQERAEVRAVSTAPQRKRGASA